MPPKKRSQKNKHLPENWRLKHGAYYYRVPKNVAHLWDDKTEFRLGKTEAEAYKTWSERITIDGELVTISQLFDRYAAEIIPDNSPGQQDTKHLAIKRLRPVFGHMRITSVKPSHAYQYLDIGYKSRGKNTTNKDFETFSHIMTMAVKWGAIDRHPFKGQVVKEKNPPRTRDIEDWEIAECLDIQVPAGKGARNIQLGKLYIKLKYMTALRRVDILNLKLSDIDADGIHITPSKTKNSTGVRLLIEWDDAGELRQVIDEITALPPRRIGDANLFVTRFGKPFNKNAFDSLWQRFMGKALRDTKLKERFMDMDIRAKNAGDSDTAEEARERLGHSSTATTNRIYRRKPRRVKPLNIQ